jgi:hypothetical protein
MRKKRGPEFECLWYKRALYRFNPKENVVTSASVKFCVRPLEISGILNLRFPVNRDVICMPIVSLL